MRNPPKLEINWKRIESFIGYGKVDAPVVFVGIEEGLSNRRALRKDLIRRSQFKAVMDLKRAHNGIHGAERYWDPVNPRSQRTWRPMCHLMLARGRAKNAPDRQQRKAYQSLHLGRTHGQTLLAELFPYPHSHTRHWLYGRFGRYPSREAYEDDVLPKRLELLRRTLAAHRRQLIICYGKSRWPEYKALMDQTYPGKIHWVAHKSAEAAIVGKTRILLVHHFSRGPFNSNTELAAFAKLART
jgi:hypothetical protein